MVAGSCEVTSHSAYDAMSTESNDGVKINGFLTPLDSVDVAS